MQIPALDAALSSALPSAAGVPARLLSGNLTGLPLGSLLRATVTAATPQNATLTVNGQVLTVRQPPGVQLQPGAVLLVRVPAGAPTATNPTLELVGTAPAAAPPPGGGPTAPQGGAPAVPQGGGSPAPQGGPAPEQPGTQPGPVRVPPGAANPGPNSDGSAPVPAAPAGGGRPGPQTATPTVPSQTDGTTAGAAAPRAATNPTPAQVGTRQPAVPSPGAAPAPVSGTTPTNGAASPVATSPAPGPVGAQPRLSVVDVLAPPVDGRVRVSVDGTEQTATVPPGEPLVAGGRYVLQVTNNPTGIVLTAPPDTPELPTAIATAILRVPAPDLSATIEPLRTELAALTNPQPGTTAAPVPAAVRAAATAVSATLQTFVPSDPRPPNATELQNLVADGGQHFEAKLARLIADSSLPTTLDPSAPAPTAPLPAPAGAAGTRPEAAPTATALPRAPDKPAASEAVAEPTEPQTATNKPTADQRTGDQQAATPDRTADPAGAVGPDLKGDLLRLLQAVKELGGPAPAPAAEATLQGIEARQAAQSLAQANGSAYYLQVPFPDGGQWRTLHLALEPQNRPDDPNADQPGRFRVFMHVPLTDLGETWIDAGLSGSRFRATIYLDRPAVRDRVRAALDDLGTELKSDGFSEVLLDVRASSELPAGRRREAGALVAGRPDTVSVLDVRV